MRNDKWARDIDINISVQSSNPSSEQEREVKISTAKRTSSANIVELWSSSSDKTGRF